MSCDVRPTCQVAECQVGHLSVQQKHHHMGLIRMMKITLAKCPSLSGYGHSQSVLSAWLVGVEVNLEGALPWSAPACLDMPGAAYQQTKADCLID